MSADPQHVRMAEALLFAAVEPLDEATLQARLPEGADIAAILAALAAHYAERGVHLMRADGRYSFATAPDLGHLLQEHRQVPRKLSRAAVETLAIIAYHQPVTRAEIEEVRGVAISKGTLDVLLEAGWVRMRGRRRTPGRPVTYGTTNEFLVHFGLESLQDLPGIEELKAAGLLDAAVRAENLFGPPPGQSLPGMGAETEDFLDEEGPLVEITPPPEGEEPPGEAGEATGEEREGPEDQAQAAAQAAKRR
ncbi:MAG: SMC-Scp complex subunit ScpB [Alphaproteobacteria bacterium]|nr:SMC-Scp complex subunit ScpB [Alphaproteobacteria bacterium]